MRLGRAHNSEGESANPRPRRRWLAKKKQTQKKLAPGPTPDQCPLRASSL